jgi:hypothetical protein
MKRFSPWLTALLQTVILLTVVAWATPWLVAESSLPIPRRSGDITLRGFQARPIFNSSVVPGGVYSLGELRAVIARDAIVANHYRDAHLDDMSVVTLTSGRAAYVSYRRGNRVYWTRERVWLKAGETVLTDGTTMIRARCGNCVSNVKQDDVAGVEPAHGELDDFVVPPTPDVGVDLLAADAEPELGELLQVPFALQTLAALDMGEALPAPGLADDAFDEGRFPFMLPPLVLPGGGGVGGVAGDPPPVSPAGFVPPDGSTDGSTTRTDEPTSPSSTTGTPGTDTITTDTLWTDALTTSAPTGAPTTGTVFVTTTGPGTSASGTAPTSGATPAPEPGVLWLVAAGIIGLASRRVRAR